MNYVQLYTLLGVTLKDVELFDAGVQMTSVNEDKFVLMHEQDCCEEVYLLDWDDLGCLVGSQIVLAEEVSNQHHSGIPLPPVIDGNNAEEEWTFYKIGTIRGTCTFRFYGRHNGCYAVDAKLYQVEKE